MAAGDSSKKRKGVTLGLRDPKRLLGQTDPRRGWFLRLVGRVEEERGGGPRKIGLDRQKEQLEKLTTEVSSVAKRGNMSPVTGSFPCRHIILQFGWPSDQCSPPSGRTPPWKKRESGGKKKSEVKDQLFLSERYFVLSGGVGEPTPDPRKELGRGLQQFGG